ncbi:DUF5710 domain-containing protein, partial [Methylogaea oryzae]|uniref:DUF5710 domain-containing protein n=1 Tax=Methylogaea oryzae TaxID=1295382 RepID=UPI0020D05A9B
MTNAKFYLNVPYAEKDQAKALGARWDASRKSGTFPPGSMSPSSSNGSRRMSPATARRRPLRARRP